MKIGLLVDVANLYYFTGQKFAGRKINFRAYYDYVADFGGVQVANAYGTQRANEAHAFIGSLKNIGFHTHFIEYKQGASNDVRIAVNMLAACEHCDTIFLGSGNANLIPAVEHVRERGVRVIALAGKIHHNLRACVTEFIEVPESMMEQRNELSS